MNNSTISGLPKVVVKTFGTKDITENGTYNAVDDSLNGYNQVNVNVSGGGGGITTNEVIRVMDLSITLVDQKTTLTESDYANASIETMIALLDKSVYGGEEI